MRVIRVHRSAATRRRGPAGPSSPEFIAGLRAQIARVAATGQPNTTYAR